MPAFNPAALLVAAISKNLDAIAGDYPLRTPEAQRKLERSYQSRIDREYTEAVFCGPVRPYQPAPVRGETRTRCGLGAYNEFDIGS
jgi:hypothetical protein